MRNSREQTRVTMLTTRTRGLTKIKPLSSFKIAKMMQRKTLTRMKAPQIGVAKWMTRATAMMRLTMRSQMLNKRVASRGIKLTRTGEATSLEAVRDLSYNRSDCKRR